MFDRLLVDSTLCCFKKPSMEMPHYQLRDCNTATVRMESWECLDRSLGILVTAWPPGEVSGPVTNVGDDSRRGRGAGYIKHLSVFSILLCFPIVKFVLLPVQKIV